MFGCMETEGRNKKRKLDLDWANLLGRKPGDEEPPLPLVVVKSERKSDEMGRGDDQAKEEFVETLPDHKLDDMIQRQQLNLEKMKSTLKDKGEKLRAFLELLLVEKKRRTLSQEKMDADEIEKPAQPQSSNTVGSSNAFGLKTKLPEAVSQSTFGATFSKRMEENTDCKVVNAFDKELSIVNHCGRQKSRSNGKAFPKEREKYQISPRRMYSKYPTKPFLGDQKDRTGSIPLCDTEDDLPSVAKKNDFHVQSSNDSKCKKGQTVVLVDEEEPQSLKTSEHEVELPNCKKEAKIYYPSRDDPESVDIYFGDIDSLAPEAFLTSQILNFYIRYLQKQASPTNKAICDYHFFNTYFYQKLQEAVSYKGIDRNDTFIKFRRWWKGVNIFQKAYVFIPINEDLHWSLAIICIPDKEDESGPIILHLDSLGLHSSRSVFKNIRSYLKEEWNYLKQEVAPSDLPIAGKIWENLPRRIDEKSIAVPQQKNDYDCGLFVLFFMERFIEEAPERLRMKDLAMFGRQWFKPEEASGLRVKIRNILIEQFQNSSEDVDTGTRSGSSPS